MVEDIEENDGPGRAVAERQPIRAARDVEPIVDEHVRQNCVGKAADARSELDDRARTRCDGGGDPLVKARVNLPQERPLLPRSRVALDLGGVAVEGHFRHSSMRLATSPVQPV